jgi:hypothetical protein
MSVDTYSYGDEAGKSFKKEARLRSLTRFFAQMGRTLADRLRHVCFHMFPENRLRIELNILVIPGCFETLVKCSK